MTVTHSSCPSAEPPAGSTRPDQRSDRGPGVWAARRGRLWSVTVAVSRELRADHVTLLASGVAFWFLFALVPATVATVSLAAIAVDTSTLDAFVADVFSAAPPEVAELVSQSLAELTASPSRPWLSAAVSIMVSVWVASSAASRLIEAVEVAYDAEETRSFLTRRFLALVLCAGGVGVAAALSVLVVWTPTLLAAGSAPGWVTSVLSVLRWVPASAVMVSSSAVLYRIAPDRRGVPASHRSRRIFPGAFTAAALWLPASAALAVYTSRFASFGSTYGPLAAVVVVMVWLFISAFAVLVGAEVNATLERGEGPGAGLEFGVPARSAVAAVLGVALDVLGDLRRRGDR